MLAMGFFQFSSFPAFPNWLAALSGHVHHRLEVLQVCPAGPCRRQPECIR
jgi:hypothetical protein